MDASAYWIIDSIHRHSFRHPKEAEVDTSSVDLFFLCTRSIATFFLAVVVVLNLFDGSPGVRIFITVIYLAECWYLTSPIWFISGKNLPHLIPEVIWRQFETITAWNIQSEFRKHFRNLASYEDHTDVPGVDATTRAAIADVILPAESAIARSSQEHRAWTSYADLKPCRPPSPSAREQLRALDQMLNTPCRRRPALPPA